MADEVQELVQFLTAQRPEVTQVDGAASACARILCIWLHHVRCNAIEGPWCTCSPHSVPTGWVVPAPWDNKSFPVTAG